MENNATVNPTCHHSENISELLAHSKDLLHVGLSNLVNGGWGRLIINPENLRTNGKHCAKDQNNLATENDKHIILDEYGMKGNGIIYEINLQDFKKIKEVGRGAHGVVTAVYHTPSHSLMALKEIRVELGSSDIKKILVELDVLSRSRSPYIVEFYGAFYTLSSVFLSIELMNIGSLNRIIKWSKKENTPIPESVLAAISFSILKGLHFLTDTLSIMHRDIKPTNILINREGQVKLCDFGVSGYLVKSLVKSHIGTTIYMAPERITMNEPTHYNAKADVWSLGSTLYEAAIGEPPFPSHKYDSPFAHLMAIIVEPLPELPDTFSPSFRDFVQKCLIKDAENRPKYKELLVTFFAP